MTLKYFRTEEMIFCGIAVSSLVIETASVVPALATCFLMGFYYIVFCWYLFSVNNNAGFFSSILLGVLYGLVWWIIGAVAVSMFGELNWFFYLIEVFLVGAIVLFLFINRNKAKEEFLKAHYLRLTIIILVNVFILIFK